MLRAAPRDADEKADHAAHEQKRARPVHPPQSHRQRQLWLVEVRADEEQGSDEPGETEGEVDVEAPAPGGAFYERPTDYWPEDDGEVLGPLSQGDHVAEDDLGHGNDASSSNALHAASDQHDCKVMCDCAERRAEGEEDDGRDDQLLATEAGRGRCNHGLKDCRSDKVRSDRPERLSG